MIIVGKLAKITSLRKKDEIPLSKLLLNLISFRETKFPNSDGKVPLSLFGKIIEKN